MTKITTLPILHVSSPMNGWCASLEDNPDPVFRSGSLGSGVSIDPTDGVVVAPFDGRISNVAATNHAVGLVATNGAEVLVHVGIDTVALKGEGFRSEVKVGQHVKQGDLLLTFDLDIITANAASLRTPVLLMESDHFDFVGLDNHGVIKVGDPLFEVVQRAQQTSPLVEVASAETYSQTVITGLAHGVHARPAALLVQSIKQFEENLYCHLEGQGTANGRSATSLMALGIKCGDNLTISAEGINAKAMVEAFIAALEPIDKMADQAPIGETGFIKLIDEEVIKAQAVGTGVAIGAALQLALSQDDRAQSFSSVELELTLLNQATQQVAEFLSELASANDGAAKDIAFAHIELLQDPAIIDQANSNIVNGVSAFAAWNQAIDGVLQSFTQSGDKRLVERADDLNDVRSRVNNVLSGRPANQALSLGEPTILIADTLLPSQLLEFQQDNLIGICLAAGGTTSHVSILATAMGIPMLVAAGRQVLEIDNGDCLVVDADYAELHHRPSGAQLESFEQRIEQISDVAAAQGDCITRCGERLYLSANIGSLSDAAEAAKVGADGCGLLRTEFVFMNRSSAPSEKDQLILYQQMSDALMGRPMTIRTLDAGADKPIAYIDHSIEENPALGVRGVRLSLLNRDLLALQVRAVLQVKSSKMLKIMLPMVTNLDEVIQVKNMIAIEAEQLGMVDKYQLGVMIETPAAALISDVLAAEVDFFSIGTNDLTQYTLSMDRMASELACDFDSLHPSVLRLISIALDSANKANISVSVCGSVAGDVLATPILLGLGLRELSMVPRAIPRLKQHIGQFDLSTCKSLADRALSMSSAADVRLLARGFIDQLGEHNSAK